jgi:hypothetical protein
MVLIAGLAVSACSGQKGLRDLRNNGTGPDEFMVLPNKPLTQPTDYAALPAPTPGRANLTDPTPKQDLVASLGGNPTALQPGSGVPATDGALVTAASRYGVEPDVRSSLAQQDADFRKRENWTARIKIFPVDRYSDAYKRQALDPFDVNEAFRDSGYVTPGSPPKSR